MRFRTTTVAVLALSTVGLVAMPTAAHVTVSTDNPEPGGFAVYTVRVPNESDSASTVRVEVQIPDGLEASRYQATTEWTMSIEDGVFVAEGGVIAPGEFQDFRFQGRNPEEARDLTFPALQTYDDGETVRWTGEAGSDTPASVVSLGSDDNGGTGDTLSLVALVAAGIAVVLSGLALARRSR
ncbi:MAG TPA: YcnI family protein [Acidimicrobiia bacterium]|nr:YcnI family protein [Acidimicrobiia bacterium]